MEFIEECAWPREVALVMKLIECAHGLSLMVQDMLVASFQKFL